MVLKIAAIECYPTAKRGGSEKAFFEVLTSLKKLGYEITLFYSCYGDLVPIYEKTGISCVKIPVHAMKYFSLRNWFHLFRGAKLINAFKADCIYINHLADAPLATFSKLFSQRTRIVCHIRVPKIGNSRIFNFCGKYINLFITLNQLIKKEYQTVFDPKKIVIINDGVEIPKHLQLIKKERKLNAVYLGRISPEKGLIELINTWEILVEKYQLYISLNITGPAVSDKEIVFKKEIEARIQQLNLAHLIQLGNPVENVIDYLGQYDFSVFPSIWEEPFGRTLAESVLAGVPVFARKVGIVEEVLAPEKENLVFVKEVELADKIFRFYTGDLYINIPKLQAHIIENYDVKKNVLLIAEKLKEISIA